MKIVVAGPPDEKPTERDMTEEELAQFEALWSSAPATIRQPHLFAVALLQVSPGGISGIDVVSKFSAALYVDVGLYYLFFAAAQPDTSFLAKAYAVGADVRVAERSSDYIAITATNADGNPVDPPELSVEIIRVQ